MTLVGALWLGLSRPETTGETLARMADRGPFGYMLTAFPVFGILLADLAALYRRDGFSWRAWELAAQIGLQVVLAILRLTVLIPVSGHVLLMAYTLLRRRWAPVERAGLERAGLERARGERPVSGRVPGESARLGRFETLLVAALLVWVSYTKLVVWGDPVTWLSALLLAGLLAFISARVNL